MLIQESWVMHVQISTCLFLQRSDIVKAAYEPTDEECEWKADEEEELTVSKKVQVISTPACLSPQVHIHAHYYSGYLHGQDVS